MAQPIDPQHFAGQARRIRAQVSAILKKWGLLPRFKRWRLTQDPGTGMVVLFGVLNNRYIASYTSLPFRDYFDPRLLSELANELQVQVVSCNTDGLRYAFILDRGQVGRLPTHIDFPFVDNGRLLARVVYSEEPPAVPVPPPDPATIDDQTRVREGVGAFLKVFDDIKLRDEVAVPPAARDLPDVVVIDRAEFEKRIAEHEANRRRHKRLKELLDGKDG